MLVGERVRLRAPERADLPHFVRWLNDPAVRHGLSIYAPLSLAHEEAWFERQLNDHHNYWLLLELREREGWRPIGSVGTDRLSPKDANCRVGIQIGEPDAWGTATVAKR